MIRVKTVEEPVRDGAIGNYAELTDQSTEEDLPIKGKKHDADKLDWSVLDFDLIEPIVEVLVVGEGRYGYENWKKDFGLDYNRRFRAARMRHEKGCRNNPLSKNEQDGEVYHLAQVAVNALFELYHARKKAGLI